MSFDLGKIGFSYYIDDRQYQKALERLEKGTQQSADNIVGIFKRAMAAIGGFFVFSRGLQEARNFSKELANIQSIAPEMSIDRLRESLRNVSSQLGSSAELANALYYAWSAGVRGSEQEMVSFTSQIAKLAKAVNGQLTPTMDAVTTVMNAYGLSVKDAGALSDWYYQIIKSGKTTGEALATSIGMIASTAAAGKIQLKELGAGIATLTTTMPTSQAVTSLNQALLGIVKPTEQAKKMAKLYGIDLSAAALAGKGLSGVLSDIRAKTGGNIEIMSQLFTSVEALKAVAALTGEQYQQFSGILGEFQANAGAADVAFKAQANSLDARLNAFGVTLQKIAGRIAELAMEIVTLGGVLTPAFDWISNLDGRTISLVAKIAAITAGLYGIRKAADGLKSLKNGVIDLAVKGGYAPESVMAARAAETEAKKKELIAQRTEATRQALSARTALVVAQNYAKETAAAQKSAAARVAAERRANLGNASPAAVKELERTTAEAAKAKKAVSECAMAYSNQKTAALAASKAVAAHTAATNVAATSTNFFGKALKGLWATMMANPLTALLALLGAVISAITIISDRMKQATQRAMEQAAAATRAAEAARTKGEAERREDMQKMQRLRELATKQSLTHSEMAEATRLADELNGKYAGLGIVVNEGTKSISMAADAMSTLIKLMQQQAKQELENELERVNDQIKAENERFTAKEATERLTSEERKKFLITLVGPMGNERGQLFSNEKFQQSDEYQRILQQMKQEDDTMRGLLNKQEDLQKSLSNLEAGFVETITGVGSSAGSQTTVDNINEQDIQEKIKASEKKAEEAKELREIVRQTELAQANAAAWADGELTKTEEIALKRKEIALQAERMSEAQYASLTAGSDKLRRIADLAYEQAHAQLGQMVGEMRTLESNMQKMQKSASAQGSFYADVLSVMSRPSTLEQKQLYEMQHINDQIKNTNNKLTRIQENMPRFQ